MVRTVSALPDPVIVHLYVRPRLRAAGSRLLVRGWLAITIGTSIVSWRRLEPHELAHELAHVRQWRRYGRAGYVVRYVASSLRAWSGGMDWYRDNRFERAARLASAASVASEPQRLGDRLLHPVDPDTADTVGMSDDDAEIQSTSDRLLAEVRRLHAAEERKRQEPVSSPEFHRLAAEVEEQARAVWHTADEQRRLAREAGHRDESIDDIAARRRHVAETNADDRASTDEGEAS